MKTDGMPTYRDEPVELYSTYKERKTSDVKLRNLSLITRVNELSLKQEDKVMLLMEMKQQLELALLYHSLH